MSEAFFKAAENRRTYYGLEAKSDISDDKIKEVVETAVKYAPSAFNMQAGRAVVVTGKTHQKVWDVIYETYIKILGGDKQQEEDTKGKIDAFRAGYGTVLFYEDQEIINGFAGKLPALAQAFPVWSDNQAGILQYIVWTALEAEGFGASLQHYGQYTPETVSELAKLLDVPTTWKSTAILPFGKPVGGPGNPSRPKTFEPLDKRVKTFFD